MKKVRIIFFIILLMITSICTIVNADEEAANPEQPVEQIEEPQLVGNTDEIITATGKIIEAGEVKEQKTGSMLDQVQEVLVEIIDGDYIGEEFRTNYVLSYDIEGKILAYKLDVGDKVTVQISEDETGTASATVLDVVRSNYIIGLFVVFLASILLVGGKKGIKAIFALVFTIVIIYFVMVKGIFKGENAIRNSIWASALIIVGTFIIIGNGINKKIVTAAVGTLGGVLTAGIVALIFNRIAKMTGACEDAIQLSVNMSAINFNFRHLLFAGIIVSALGACMDVGMSIASSLDEIKMKNPEITGKELFISGMNIGRDVIGTMSNTLILAYVGSSITLILLFMACNMNLMEILNKETIAEQIVSAVSGSIGVIYTVPITSLVYSVFNRDKVIYKKTSENKLNGKRSLKI